MSLTNLTTKTSYAGNGVTTVFPFTFKVFQAADLVVTETTAAGVTTTLILNTDYTVTGAGLDAGGSITRTSPPPTGTTGLIRRVVALTQTADIRNQSAFYASVHEDVFDKLTMVDQQQEEEIGRSVQLPEQYAAGVSTQLPQPVALTALAWNASGTGLINIVIPGTTATYVASFNGRSGAVVPAANDYGFSQLSGSVAATQLPAFTGDVTTSAGSTVTTLAPTQPGAHTWSAVQTFSAGTVGLPSTTLGDSTTGFYRSALNQWAWGASGVNILTFSSSGLASTATLSGTTITASSQFTGPGTGLTGTASSLTSGSVIPGGTKPHFVGNGAITRFSYDGSSTVYRTDWQGTQQLYSTARTNLIPDSNTLTAWSGVISGTGAAPVVTGAYATGPDGVAGSASRVQFNQGSGLTSTDYSFLASPGGNVSIGSTYIGSAWIKSNTGSAQPITLSDSGAGASKATFSIGTSWVRIASLPWVSTISTNNIYIGQEGDLSHAATGDFLIAFGQLELGSLATSYIPTTTAAVTVTDYTVASNVLTTATAPLAGAVMEGVGAYDIGGNAATASTSNALQSATTTVNVSSATAPTAGQVLTATSGTAATWALREYDIGGGCTGKPSASAVILRMPAVRAFTLPTNLSGSQGKAGTAATASTTFNIAKNGTNIGTMVFAASGTVPTWTCTATSFAAGDILTITAPASQDATLADIGFVLAGSMA